MGISNNSSKERNINEDFINSCSEMSVKKYNLKKKLLYSCLLAICLRLSAFLTIYKSLIVSGTGHNLTRLYEPLVSELLKTTFVFVLFFFCMSARA